jgi:polyferredoxin
MKGVSVKAVGGDVFSLIIYAGLVLAGILVILMWIKNRTRKITVLRFFIQTVSLLVIFSAIFLISLWNSLLLGIIIFVLPIFFGRFFCGWLCPFGLYQDFISLVRKLARVRYVSLPDTLNRYLHKLKYILAASMLTLPFFYGPLNPQTWSAFLQFQNPFKPLIIIFMGPLEPLLIPWAGGIGFGGYSLSYPYIRGITLYFPISIYTTIAVWLLVGLTIAGAVGVRRFWCRFCPTGVSISALNRFPALKRIPLTRINKSEEKCTKCGICKRVCPVQVTEVYEQKGGDIGTSMCLICMRCVEMCPYEGCLKVKVGGKTVIKSRNWLEPSKLNLESES